MRLGVNLITMRMLLFFKTWLMNFNVWSNVTLNSLLTSYESQKSKIGKLKNEKNNFFEKIRFLDIEHNFVLEKNKDLSLEIEKLRKDIVIKNKIFHLKTKVWIKSLINISLIEIKET